MGSRTLYPGAAETSPPRAGLGSRTMKPTANSRTAMDRTFGLIRGSSRQSVSFLSPLRGLRFFLRWRPSARALGGILSPLRGLLVAGFRAGPPEPLPRLRTASELRHRLVGRAARPSLRGWSELPA